MSPRPGPHLTLMLGGTRHQPDSWKYRRSEKTREETQLWVRQKLPRWDAERRIHEALKNQISSKLRTRSLKDTAKGTKRRPADLPEVTDLMKDMSQDT